MSAATIAAKANEDEMNDKQNATIANLKENLNTTQNLLSDEKSTNVQHTEDIKGLRSSLKHVEESFAKDKAERQANAAKLNAQVEGLEKDLYKMTEKEQKRSNQLRETEVELKSTENELLNTEQRLGKEREAHQRTRNDLTNKLNETEETLR